MVGKCPRKYTKRYTSRPGPAYPANECPEKTIKSGNDGNLYVNLPNKRGIRTWRMYKLRNRANNGRRTAKRTYVKRATQAKRALKKAATKRTYTFKRTRVAKSRRAPTTKRAVPGKLLKCKKMYYGKDVVEIRVKRGEGHWRRAKGNDLARCTY